MYSLIILLLLVDGAYNFFIFEIYLNYTTLSVNIYCIRANQGVSM